MVEAGEEIRSIETRGHDSGFQARPGIIHTIQPVIDRRSSGARDRNDRRIVSARLFRVRKEETAVATDRSAHSAAILNLSQQIFLRRQRIARIKALITRETIRAAAPIICSRLSHDVDDAAGGPAKLSNAARRDDL